VSAYFRNGSFIDIAKIEGGDAYKTSMLGLPQTLSSTTITVPRYCPSSQQVCEYWPLQTVDTKVQNPLAPMLKALLSAAEATLETDVRSTMVATHAIENVDVFRILILAAFDQIEATNYDRHFRVVDNLVPAMQLEGVCNDTMCTNDPERYVVEQLFLGIEYTRGSLNAAMFYQECGDYEMLSRVSFSKVGYDATSACKSIADNTTACNDALETALRRVIRDAGSYNTRKKPELDEIFIFGEKAEDENMLAVLDQVLRDWTSNGASLNMSRVRGFSPDPAFAGARAMAFAELEHKDYLREHAEEERTRRDEL
jgi:hypothetical protein